MKLFNQKSPQNFTIEQTGATGFPKLVPQSFAWAAQENVLLNGSLDSRNLWI
jgi:hypothetical protein